MQLNKSSKPSQAMPGVQELFPAALTVNTHALRLDHRTKVAKLFSDFESLKDSDERKAAILTRICLELTLQEHVEAELLAHAASSIETQPN